MAEATRGGNHVFFGEPHADGAIVKQYELLAQNPDMFKAASQNGVKHLVMEFPAGLQSSVDSYQKGAINRQEFRNDLEQFGTPWAQGAARDSLLDNIVKATDNAHAAGMRVHFADVKATESMETAQPPILQAWAEKVDAQHKSQGLTMPLDDYALQQLRAMPEKEREVLNNAVEEHGRKWESRRMDDTAQYLYLRERIPPHKAIMGVVGMSHLNDTANHNADRKITGIDDYLEQEGRKVTTIEVHTNRTRGFTDALNRASDITVSDPPDYVLNLDDRTITARGSTQAQPLDAVPEKRLADLPTVPALAAPGVH